MNVKKFDNYFSIHFNLICSFTSYGMVNVLLKIEFLKEKPLDVDFSEKFKIKKNEYTICGKINSSFKNYEFPDENKYTKSVYLSSHLQKAIRRMDSEKSVKDCPSLYKSRL